jgi:hypothetical protein
LLIFYSKFTVTHKFFLRAKKIINDSLAAPSW